MPRCNPGGEKSWGGMRGKKAGERPTDEKEGEKNAQDDEDANEPERENREAVARVHQLLHLANLLFLPGSQSEPRVSTWHRFNTKHTFRNYLGTDEKTDEESRVWG